MSKLTLGKTLDPKGDIPPLQRTTRRRWLRFGPFVLLGARASLGQTTGAPSCGEAMLTGLCGRSEVPLDQLITWDPDCEMVVDGYVNDEFSAQFGKDGGVPSGTVTLGQLTRGREGAALVKLWQPGARESASQAVVNAVRGSFFADGFEADTGWRLFEEIVEAPCYVDGAGDIARTREVSFRGDLSLLVHSNKRRTNKSNHVSAIKRISDYGRGGKWAYCVNAYIAPETVNSGQVGPEFSMQNTGRVGSAFLTTTAGLQYRANPFLQAPEKSSIAVWVEAGPGKAQWLPIANEDLKPATWYWFCLEADFDQNRYIQLLLRGGGLDRRINLSEHHIAQEAKWSEEAFWLSLEAQNLWSCQDPGMYEYKIYYDEVRLTRSSA